MLENARDILKTYAAGKKIAVAVSGGRDSMCLLSLALEERELFGDIFVINVEHGLRENSLSDSEFVKDHCARLGVKFECVRRSVPERMRASGRGAEEEARLLRKEVFASVIESGKAELVLTAHHKDDNAETVLLNILRGSGTGGLKGMQTITKGGILRPLLNSSREEIDEYIRARELPFVTDETNADTDYTRNFIRLEVMPLIAKRFNPREALTALAAKAKEDDDYIFSGMDLSLIKNERGGVTLPAEVLTETPAVAKRYAREALRRLTSDYSALSIEGVLQCARLSSGGKREIAGGITAVKEYDSVRLVRAKKAVSKERAAVSFGSFRVGGFDLEITPCEKPSEEEMKSSAPVSKRTLYLDLDRIPKSAVIRTRAAGDTFEPFGGGKRKLKEYLIDKKIPLSVRDELPLICDGSTVLAVCGYELAPAVKLTDKTKRCAAVTLKERERAWNE